MSTTSTSTAGQRATSAPGRAALVSAVTQRAALVVLLIVIAISAVAFPSFGSLENLRNITIQVSAIAIVALGMTFVIITGGIDLSVGSVFALGGVLAAWGAMHNPLLGVVLPLVVCGLIGLVQGLIIRHTGMPPFIVTLAGLLGVRGLMLSLTHEGNTTYQFDRDASWFASIGAGSVAGVPVPVIIVVVLFAVGVLVLERTRYGRTLLAVGGAPESARLMGLPVDRSLVAVYAMSGLLTGLAGVINASRLSSGVTTIGIGMELDAIAAVVIGGTLLVGGVGSVGGTLWGVLLLGVIQNVINQIGNLNSSFQSVVSAVFLVLVVVGQQVLGHRQGTARRVSRRAAVAQASSA